MLKSNKAIFDSNNIVQSSRRRRTFMYEGLRKQTAGPACRPRAQHLGFTRSDRGPAIPTTAMLLRGPVRASVPISWAAPLLPFPV